MMKMRTILLIVAALVVMPATGGAQTLLNQVWLNAAVTSAGQNTIDLTVADSVSVGHVLYVDNEAMIVATVNTTTDRVTVRRGQLGTSADLHAKDTIVWTGAANAFYYHSPKSGRCTAASAYPGGYKPWINILTGGIFYCDDNTYGPSAPGFWKSPGGDAAGIGRFGYTAIAYRTSRTADATVVTPSLTLYLWDSLVASLTYTGSFEVFLPSPTGLLGKRIVISDVAQLATNHQSSSAGRTITIRGLFENGDNTKTLARFNDYHPATGLTTVLTGVGATTSFYVGITASSIYYWFAGW